MRTSTALFRIVALYATCQSVGAQTKMLRDTDLHGEQVVFANARD